jgi:uncharacterized protein YunC (DUF1805 family)
MSGNPNTLELSIAVEGKIISSNFHVYKEYAVAQIGAINLDLKTDEDFEQAAKDVKGLKTFEDRLKQAEVDFLSQMDEVDSLLKSVRELGGLSRETRLNAEKRIAARKAEMREGIIRDGMAALEVKSREFGDMIGDAIKGKSSLVKMQEAVTAVVETVNARTRTNRAVFAQASEAHGDAVAYGEEAFLCLTVEIAKVEMERRIERHRAALKEAELKAERDRLQREADERARQERLAEQAAEEKARQESTANEAERRSEWEKQEAAVKTELTPPTPTPAPAPAPAQPATQATGQTAAEEMECFLSVLTAAFAPAKEARAQLRHAENIQRAGAFAEALGAAFKALKSPKA